MPLRYGRSNFFAPTKTAKKCFASYLVHFLIKIEENVSHTPCIILIEKMSAYTGEDLLSYDANIAKLKEAFTSLLPEIFSKGNQEQFTSLKENFPCVRASSQTNPSLLAQAKLKDQETLSNLNEVLEAFQFIETCFSSSLINREGSIVNRDEALAFTCYDVLHGQLLVINQALLCW